MATSRNINIDLFPSSSEHGKVIRATRYYGCSEFGYEYWETYLKYEDGFVESVDFDKGDDYDH